MLELCFRRDCPHWETGGNGKIYGAYLYCYCSKFQGQIGTVLILFCYCSKFQRQVGLEGVRSGIFFVQSYFLS